MACWAQRKEPLGEGRPQSWKAGTKGTRHKGTGREPAFSSRQELLPPSCRHFPGTSLSRRASHRKRWFQVSCASWARLNTVLDLPYLVWSLLTYLFKASQLPLMAASPGPICHPEERQRIIYLKKRKPLKCQPGTDLSLAVKAEALVCVCVCVRVIGAGRGSLQQDSHPTLYTL